MRAYLEKKLIANNIRHKFLPAERSGKYAFLQTLITAEKVTDIIVCGGDGTVNQVVSHVTGTKINIGIIPMGSGNGLAFAAGIPKDFKKAFGIILEGKARYIDAFTVNGRFSCMLCGLGFDAQVAHAFGEKNSRGLSTYIRETVKHFFKAEAYPFQVKANSAVINTEAFFISIANSNQFGNNLTIAPQASLSDGLLDIVIANRTGKLNLIFRLLTQIRCGKIVKASDPQQTVHYFQTQKMSVANPGMAPLHIDGEIAETSEYLEIEILPKAFLLLHPQKK